MASDELIKQESETESAHAYAMFSRASTLKDMGLKDEAVKTYKKTVQRLMRTKGDTKVMQNCKFNLG